MWLLNPPIGVSYNPKTYELKAGDGKKIASLFVNSKGWLTILLEVNTKFIAAGGKTYLGSNAATSTVSIWDGGGTLEYNHKPPTFSERSDKVINVKIMMLKGSIVSNQIIPVAKSFQEILLEAIKKKISPKRA